MSLYAENTTVDVGRTQAQLRKLIEKYGGQWIGVVTDPGKVRQVDCLAFKLAGMPIRFSVHHPQAQDPEVCNAYNMDKALKAEYRRRWREIYLMVKSRLIEAVLLKRDVNEVFFAQLVTKTGQTLWEVAQKDVGALLSGGDLNQLLALPIGDDRDG